MMTRIVLLLVLGLATALPAAAQNASTAGALDLYGTYHAVGARLTFTGDANANATARLEWRLQGAPTWTTGMPMTRITNSRWAASVLWLQPDTPYEVRAVIIDPDGGGSTTGSIRTRTPASTTPTGATIWVATNGSDGNNGTSGAPLATLQAAADRANPGDQIRVRPGLYYQSVDVGRAGSASAMIHLVADGPGVILDGSDPAYLNRSDWRDDGGGVFSVPYTGTTRLVCADSLMRLYHHASLANLNAATYGVTQGWAAEGGRLYVKLEGGVSPIGRRMHVARYNIGINLDQSYWRVDGFEIRHFGTVANGGGVVTINANRCVISNNHVHTVGGRNIFMRIGSNEQLVENNLCRDPRIGTWPWDATKAHEEEVQGISDRGGRGSVIRYNTIRGIFDGIDTADFANDENSCADTDIYENLVTDCGDDPIEPESCAGLNLRVWRNRADNSYAGISIAPNSVGPTYVLYNTITNYRTRGYKTSISHTGQTYVFHNTFSSIHTPTAAGAARSSTTTRSAASSTASTPPTSPTTRTPAPTPTSTRTW